MNRQEEAGFAALVVHELRSPLAAMVGAARMLRARWPELDDAKRDALLALLADESGRVERLLGDLQDASRVAAGGFAYEFAEVDPVRLVEDAVAAARVAAGGASVRARLDEPLPLVRGDADRLRQALDNLIGNAVKASPPGGEVEVGVENRDGTVRISVMDSGPGVAAADRDRIFEAFEQAGNRPGAGLGLHVARTIAEAHGGAVELDSTPGGGATFALVLPI
ncbi:MAG: HAMP domain-containing histidine kinase [Actinobacteria bacterium]|nr:HAMP domain-containing histidine kinase [Actinomycetota bacterium]